jgi:hypothetical protein
VERTAQKTLREIADASQGGLGHTVQTPSLHTVQAVECVQATAPALTALACVSLATLDSPAVWLSLVPIPVVSKAFAAEGSAIASQDGQVLIVVSKSAPMIVTLEACVLMVPAHVRRAVLERIVPCACKRPV